MADTLLLDANWDLTLDENGDIAVATGGYAVAQDVASAVRVFKGELWYQARFGMPYHTRVLGRAPPASWLGARFVAIGKRVPDVAAILPKLKRVGPNRELTGELRVTTVDGQLGVVTVNPNRWVVEISP